MLKQSNSGKVIINNNGIYATGDVNNSTVNINGVNKLDWEKLKVDTRMLKRELHGNEEELIVVENMYDLIVQKDELCLKKFIIENINTFKKSVFSSLATSFLYNFIQNIIKTFI